MIALRLKVMKKNSRLARIVVADDHPVVLSGLVMLLSNDKKAFRLVASCSNGKKALDAIRRLKPEIALLDLNMPGLSGLQVLKAVLQENLPTRVCFIAASPSDKEIVAATEGAYAIVLKESAPDILITCLHAVAAGQKCMPADLVDGAIQRTRERQAQIAKVSRLLTDREIEVMLRVADGLSNKEVGNQLNISEGTVKMHLHSVYHKVGVNNRTSLVNFANTYRDRLTAN
jgi:two-component system, NarL family, nitrate/nitrite response regulator NarL